MSAAQGDGPVGVVSVLSFVCELAMLGLLAWAGWRLGGGSTPLKWVATIVPAALVVVIWGRWMAPNSSTRLDDPGRLVAQIALFAVVGGLLVLAGRTQWGIGFAVTASVVFAASRVLA